MNIDELVRVGFTLSTATDLSAFFTNGAYVADFTEDDLLPGYEMPDNKMVVLQPDGHKQMFPADSVYYKDIETIFAQNGNAEPNRGGINNVIVFQKTTESDFGAAFEALMTVNANFTQVTISSRDPVEIEKVADKLATADRLFEAQTSSEAVANKSEGNVAQKLADKNNDRVKITFHSNDEESAAGAIMSIQAGEKLGARGDIFSKLTNVSTQQYNGTQEANFKALNVSFYTTVNPINGGGVEQYGTKIYSGGKMINGENAKRRRIRYYFDKMMKARSLDFLGKKLDDDDDGGAVLESMLSAILVEGQSSGLVVKDNEDSKGFVLRVLSMAEMKRFYNSLYSKKCYKATGWYIDKLTGEAVEIGLTVDPSDAEKSIIEGI